MNMLAFLSASDTKISDAAVYAIVGFCIVLLVLALLVGLFYLSGFLFRTKALSKEKLFEFKKKQKDETAVQSVADEQSDEELYAVISAVISTIYDEEAQGDSVKPDFVIRRIKRSK